MMRRYRRDERDENDNRQDRIEVFCHIFDDIAVSVEGHVLLSVATACIDHRSLQCQHNEARVSWTYPLIAFAA